jgi:hypothetical protein
MNAFGPILKRFIFLIISKKKNNDIRNQNTCIVGEWKTCKNLCSMEAIQISTLKNSLEILLSQNINCKTRTNKFVIGEESFMCA